MRKTRRFCFSPDFLEPKLSPSALGYTPAPVAVQVETIEDVPTLPPSFPPTDPGPTDPTDPSPEPGMPGGPEDPC